MVFVLQRVDCIHNKMFQLLSISMFAAIPHPCDLIYSELASFPSFVKGFVSLKRIAFFTEIYQRPGDVLPQPQSIFYIPLSLAATVTHLFLGV